MRAIVVAQTGGPEVLTLTDVRSPEPGPGQILVSVAAAGINFIDVYQRGGLYRMPDVFTPGLEGAGRVLATGEGVTEFAAGDLVAWLDQLGSYAELAVVRADRAVPVPDGLTADIAAAAMMQGTTAQYLCRSTYPIQPGETALIHAAAGGTGLILTQLVKALGGKVVATVSTEEKEKLSRGAGADEVIRYGGYAGDGTSGGALAAEVRRLNGGEAVHVVYDGVGRDTWEASLKSLRPRGTLVSFGNASGAVAPFAPLELAAAGSLYVTRPTNVHYTATRADLLWRTGDVFGRVLDGSLRISVSATYPLADAGQAHRDLEARKTTGKLLLLP